ncbi:leucine-rich_repeat domain-containing protein [Hexamita inflata]|uniref:Leucine-rich repeat domain-containing protein n=1 Tax=Hexamita inflata TaxID=28002 RepID=A0AA86USH1_9EUKA|nr:leucine-rich repeat domain-containing protein [Hexamita inflata]
MESRLVDIADLSFLTNLTHLNIEGNMVENIQALQNLRQLSYLNLSGNKIESISSLSKLTNISQLILDHNMIIDISALCDLQQLSFVNLQHNQIIDCNVLKKLKQLKVLMVMYNFIQDPWIAPFMKHEKKNILQFGLFFDKTELEEQRTPTREQISFSDKLASIFQSSNIIQSNQYSNSTIKQKMKTFKVKVENTMKKLQGEQIQFTHITVQLFKKLNE